MFDIGSVGQGGAPLATADVAAFAAVLAQLPAAGSEADNIDRIRMLEELKAVCAAVQARETVALYESRVAAEAARGIPASRRGRGVASEVALARRVSPSQGSRHVGFGTALVHEMPHTMAALSAGVLSEWRATIMVRETGWLPVEGRRHVDAVLADRLTGLGDRRLAAEARRLAQAWDPAGAVSHLARVEQDRRVTIRSAPDAMVRLTALLPMVPGVATYAVLDRDAKTIIGSGQAGDKTRGQVMADLMVERLTGQASAAAVPIEVHLIMTDTALLGVNKSTATGEAAHGEAANSGGATPDAADSPAWLAGYGPLPAAAARGLLDPVRDDPSGKARVWLRRLFTDPKSGQLVAMDSKRRRFDGLLRRMVILRDDTCRTPWCDAPIRHVDHVVDHAAGGRTSFANASGLCERCNHIKEDQQWRHNATPEQLEIITPTGHHYRTDTLPLHPGRRTSRNQQTTPPRRGQPANPRHIDIHYRQAS